MPDARQLLSGIWHLISGITFQLTADSYFTPPINLLTTGANNKRATPAINP